MLVLVVGPSGAGKDTLLNAAREALRDDERFVFVRRAITRVADVTGEDHEPVDAASFELRRAAGAYALSWDAHGLRYGIPAEIALDIDAGRVVVANVSRGVLREAMRRYPAMVVEITAPPEVLARRLAARGREDEGDILQRLRRSVDVDADDVVTIVNDGSVEEGTRRLLEALSRAAETARR